MITQFKGEYNWLSNFATVKIEYDGKTYNSVEHAYLSAKSDDMDWKQICTENYSAGALKKISKGIDIVPHWDDTKIGLMKMLLVQKFQKEPFKSKLKNTGDILLEEGNYWGDVFWGVDLKTGFGDNVLGKIIMEIRKIIIEIE